MVVDRQFLDLFWDISGDSSDKRKAAKDKLVKLIVDSNGKPKGEYFDYTLERLVKGLKSFSSDARTGFSETLTLILNKYIEFTPVSLLSDLFKKHIYASESSTKTEETSTKHAYLLCLSVYYESQRLRELTFETWKQLVDPIFSLLDHPNWRSQVLWLSGTVISKVSSKIVRKVFTKFTESVWNSFISQDSDFLGDQLLYLLRVQSRLKHILLENDEVFIDLSSKKFRKKFVHGVLQSSDTVAVALLDEIIQQNALESLWPKICDKSCSPESPTKHRRVMLKLVSHVICRYGDRHTQVVLSESVVRSYTCQLASRDLACFVDACSLMRQSLDAVVLGSTQQSQQESQRQSPDTDGSINGRPASPETLFSLLVSYDPWCDLFVAPKAPKPCRFLLEHCSQYISSHSIENYANKLMELFCNPEIFSLQPVPLKIKTLPHLNATHIRVSVTAQLQWILRSMISKDSPLTEQPLTYVILNFLIKMGFATRLKKPQSEHPVSDKESAICWTAIHRYLDQLATHSHQPNAMSKVKTVLLHLLASAVERLNILDHENCDYAEKLSSTAQRSLSLLNKVYSEDCLGSYIATLHGISALLAISQPSDASNVQSLLDDLYECHKRRRSQQKSGTDAEPQWTAVLTDVLLGLFSVPSRMLRSYARLTFQNLVVANLVDTDCLNLICDVIRSRLKEESSTVGEEEPDEDDDEESLIEFPSNVDAGGCLEDDHDADSNDHGSDADEMPDDDAADNASDVSSENADEHQTMSEDLDDDAMFAQDEALAAVFKMNRLTSEKRVTAEKTQALGQMKMRCLDFLECILQHGVRPELLWATFIQLVELGRLASISERVTGKGRMNVKLAVRFGDLPSLARLVQIGERLRHRPAALQLSFINTAAADPNTAVKFDEIVTAIITNTRLKRPPPDFIKLITAIMQFLYRVASALHQTHPDLAHQLSEPIVKELDVFLVSSRRVTVHSNILFSLLGHCQALATEASPNLIKAFVNLITEKPEERTKGERRYTFVQCCLSLSTIFKALTNGSFDSPELTRAPVNLLHEVFPLINQSEMSSKETAGTVVWLLSPLIARRFFQCLMHCVRAVKQPETIPLLQASALSHLRNCQAGVKLVRKTARSFANFMDEIYRKGGRRLDDADRMERLRLKNERKKARQAKRRERELKRKQTDLGKLSTENQPPQKSKHKAKPKKQQQQQGVPFQQAPRPKDTKMKQSISLKRATEKSTAPPGKRQKIK